jgi:hypothetical protein
LGEQSSAGIHRIQHSSQREQAADISFFIPMQDPVYRDTDGHTLRSSLSMYE